ncbi:unnamed protein product, partial [Scytosiphon promiscuus]
ECVREFCVISGMWSVEAASGHHKPTSQFESPFFSIRSGAPLEPSDTCLDQYPNTLVSLPRGHARRHAKLAATKETHADGNRLACSPSWVLFIALYVLLRRRGWSCFHG